MLRRIVFSGLAAGSLAVVIAWGFWQPAVVARDGSPSDQSKRSDNAKSQLAAPASRANSDRLSGEQLLVQAPPTAPLPGIRPTERRHFAIDPIVIPLGRLRLIEQEDVPSQRDGVVMFIGTEIIDGEQVPTYDVLEVQMGETKRRFRRLKEGDYVKADQLVALVDDTLARADVAIKVAKLYAAQAEKIAEEKTREEALSRYETQKKLYYNNVGGIRATPKEEMTGALLTYNKYVETTKMKEQAINVAQEELNQARKTLSMYEIHPKVSGTVKLINKHPGEAVKSLDPVLQIQNYDRLRVDALLPEQYANRLEKGMKVMVEPAFRESPTQSLIGHRGLVTGVAVSQDPQRALIVSCSLDRTVRVWEPSANDGRMRETRVLHHPVGVRAIACTPYGAKVNLCLSGDDHGKGRLWELNDRTGDKPLHELTGEHRDAILCAAFSPDGQTCATGGEDQKIMVWDTATGNRRYQISGHSSPVTALHFAPDKRLISVSRDSVRFWRLGADRAEALDETIHRGREPFDNLGVSPDGQRMMDEEGGEMRVISIPGARTEAIIRCSTSLNKRFVNFALFSPDGTLALTTPQTGGMVQLWRIDKTRSYELRQFVSTLRDVVKSAAFAPDGSFVVAAVNDRLDVWPMPANEEIKPIPAYITNIEKPIEAVENQVKVTAELDNPDQRLRPGDVVTMVAYPQK
jgi:WD40 repeat protein